MSVEEHRKASPKQVDCWVITVSDTRGSKEDISGDLIVNKLTAAGHVVKGRSWTKDGDGFETGYDLIYRRYGK